MESGSPSPRIRRSLQLEPLHLLSSSPPSTPTRTTNYGTRRQSSVNTPYRPPKEREPVTLGEKHADLLQFIAQKESKCLELRSQLAIHEKELLELKRKWERIVQRGFDRQQQQQQLPTPRHTPTCSDDTCTSPPTLAQFSATLPPELTKTWGQVSKRASWFGSSIAQALAGDSPPAPHPRQSSPRSPLSAPQPSPVDETWNW